MESSGTRWRCVSPHPGGVALRVKVSPNASKTEAQGLREDRLRVRLQAPPVDGKANEALRTWAAKTFGLRARQVEILKGDRQTEKVLLLRGTTPDAASSVLDRLFPEAE